MNRASRRKVTKGDKATIQDNLKQANQKTQNLHNQLQNRIASIDLQINERAKQVSALVIKHEFMPIVRDVLAIDLGVDDERVAKFEKFFETRKDKRLEKIDTLRAKYQEDEAKKVQNSEETEPEKKEYTKPTIEEAIPQTEE